MIDKYDKFRNKFIRSSINDIQDPAYITFGLKFNFFPRIITGASPEPGLLTGLTRRYLQSRGDTLRVNKLDYFITLLKRFSIDEPWWFTSISGIDKLFTIDYTKGRLAAGANISVTARESVDLKFLSLLESYRSLVTDKVYMREILPRNLRKFDLNIYLIDPRILTRIQNGKLEYDDDQQGVIVLKLEDCEFDLKTSYSQLATVSNEEFKTPLTHSFSISVDRVYEMYNLPTNTIFGYTGTGYYSDDHKDDFNFLTNLIRPKSTLFAESGNERSVKTDKYSNYIKSSKLSKINIEEETAEEAMSKRKKELIDEVGYGTERERLNMDTLTPIENLQEKLDLSKLTPISNRNQRNIL